MTDGRWILDTEIEDGVLRYSLSDARTGQIVAGRAVISALPAEVRLLLFYFVSHIREVLADDTGPVGEA